MSGIVVVMLSIRVVYTHLYRERERVQSALSARTQIVLLNIMRTLLFLIVFNALTFLF